MRTRQIYMVQADWILHKSGEIYSKYKTDQNLFVYT
jgi:hypothetical protein